MVSLQLGQHTDRWSYTAKVQLESVYDFSVMLVLGFGSLLSLKGLMVKSSVLICCTTKMEQNL